MFGCQHKTGAFRPCWLWLIQVREGWKRGLLSGWGMQSYSDHSYL